MFGEDKFICAFNSTDTSQFLRICIFFFTLIDGCKCKETFCEDSKYDNDKIFFDGVIYDTSNTTIKVINAKYIGESSLSWTNIFIDPFSNRFSFNEIYFDLLNRYSDLNCDTKNCDFNQFYSEYLLCCAYSNYIMCSRLSNNFQILNYFKLMINGENPYVKIIDKGNYESIFLINNNTNNSLFKKYLSSKM